MSEVLQIILGVSLALGAFASLIFFLLEQQNILENIRPENRLLPPGRVWRQLIPLYGMIYQFTVINRIADSIRLDLAQPSETDWLSAIEIKDGDRPTYKHGLTLAILSCCSIIRFPVLENLIALAILVAWIVYWIELRKYHKEIKLRQTGSLAR